MNKVMIVLATATVFAAGVAQAADPEAYVEYRKAAMGAVGGHMVAIATRMKTGVEVPDDTALHATAIAGILESFPAAFPEGTAGVGKTEAKDAIWSNMDDFKAKAMKGAEAATALAAAAESGADMSEIGAKVGDLGKACKGCHEDYKEK
ncbi:MAG: cytochrome c [Rhodospirillum sp.]|nr:cytochrome c [Rhodospirillum sp.]MCF8488548.1 cytochrome c [Rhodospirillum sp.]MCF8499144.1 cytochrome c [Rhodospirillum sp.]